MEKNKRPRGLLLTSAVLAVVLGLSAVNISLLAEPAKALRTGETDFPGFVERVRKAYTSDQFVGKNAFVDLNGLFARLTGRQVYNGVVRLKNGMLTVSYPACDVTPLAEEIAQLDAYLRTEEIPFLYVQAPEKLDVGKALLQEGTTDFGNENADALLALLEETGVNTLDLRPMISATPEQVEQYYFRTDHHWNFTGAFLGFQQIVDRLDTLLPVELDKTYASPDQWESNTKEDAFLGSRGKRVGRFYGGVDDVTYYVPAFETRMSCAIPKHRKLFKGDFAEANIRSDYLEGEPDYFSKNPYAMYIGGDYPLVKHRNENAPNDLRLLMLKDSYTLPVQAYLSTLVKEIDVIDPRHFQECSVAEYAAWFQPDAVVLMMNPSTFGEKGYADLGVEQAEEYGQQELRQVLAPTDEHIPARESAYNYNVYTTGLETGKTYELRFSDVTFLTGSADGAVAALYEPKTEKLHSVQVFDIGYCRENGGFSWRFRTPEEAGELQLLLYSGVPGTVQNVETYYSGVELLCGE